VRVAYDLQHLLIYLTLLLYLASVAGFAWRRRVGLGVFGAGFAAGIASLIYRGLHVGHMPLQNLFEVMLFAGTMVFPLAVLMRRWLGVGAEWIDAIMGLLLLFPVGFVFDAAPRPLPPVLQSGLFVPHVGSYMIGYVILIKAGILGGVLAVRGPVQLGDGARLDEGVSRVIRLGFPLLTAGLLLGSVWAKYAWGDWWNWDPKELWSLASWLAYVIYFHFRFAYPRRRARIEGVFAVLGAALVIITLLWANLSRLFAGMHSYA
jgi:ABC-type transport system involved in cytochrome c biogenesis permease subunit